MNKPTVITKQEPRQGKVFCFSVMPGLEPELYHPILNSDLDAIVIGAVPTGGVPNQGIFSFIPFIREATEKQIPVYLLRGSLTAAQRPPHEYVAYRRDLRTMYEPERDAITAAITAGAIPLERPDISQLLEVVAKIRRIYGDKPSYDEGVEAVSREFSSSEFMEAIKRIRQKI